MGQWDTAEADWPVIEAVREGDAYAFRELVDRHGPWIRGVVFAVLTDGSLLDDAMQQVWVQVWRRVGELRDPRAWRPWIARLARNVALDYGRRVSRDRRRRRRQDAAAGMPLTAEDGEQVATRAERQVAVLRAVRALPALYREPFVLRHINGWGYREIAEVLGIPIDTVETRLVRARRLLREALENRL